MANVLVTGGAGFIGSHIVDTLKVAGHKVSVLDDLSSGVKSNLPADVELFEADIRSKEAADFIRKAAPEIIVHAAAQISVRVSMENPMLDVDVNVMGLMNILTTIREIPMPYIVFISTGGAIYGEQTQFPAPESHAVSPLSIYGLSKRVSELYLGFWASELKLRFCSLRLANVFGPRQNPHGEAGVVAIFNQRLLAGKDITIYGEGNQTRDFVYVKDVASAVSLGIEKRAIGIFNVGTGIETSVNELCRGICNAVGTEFAPHYAERKAGEQMRSCIDASLAREQLGWSPQTDLNAGLRETAEWFRAAPSSR